MSKEIKRLFFDTETSPNIGYFWRPGYKLSIGPENIIQERAVICVCYKWEHEDDVQYIPWENPFDDRRLIEQFIPIANEADELIAHNGDHFDIPWFQGRCVKHGFDPLPEYKTVDTLAIARRKFGFNSNKLDYLAKYLCGHGKVDTNFGLWKAVCEGDPKALAQMVKYCQNDVLILQEVWEKIKTFYRPAVHAGVLAGHDRWTCPNDGSEDVFRDKVRVSAAGIERHQMKCKKCGRYFTIANNVFLQYLERNASEDNHPDI